jgi:hypothetical protein
MATNTHARARTSGATKATATKATKAKATKATLEQPKTPEEMAATAVDVVKAATAVTSHLVRYGFGMLANIVDRDGAISRLVKAGKTPSTAKAYASAAIALAKAHNVSSAFRKAISDGIGYDDGYEWAREIVAADKAGDEIPTRAQATKAVAGRAAKRAADAAARRAKEDADKAAADKAKPTTVADLVALIGGTVDKAAQASGDAATFYGNLAKWAAGEHDVRKAAAEMARATTAK